MTTIAKYEPEQAESAATLALSAAEALDDTLRSMPMPSSAAAVQLAKQVKARRQALKKERDDFAKPLRALATKHSKRWNPSIKVFQELERYLKGVALELEAAEQAAQQLALAAATTAEQVALAATPVDSGLGKSTTWVYEIVNESEIPEEYWMRILDRPRLEREAREQKDEFDVRGVRAVPKTTGVLR